MLGYGRTIAEDDISVGNFETINDFL